MDAVLGIAREDENERVGIVDRLVGCLQPVLTILGKADLKQHKPGTYCARMYCVYLCTFIILLMLLFHVILRYWTQAILHIGLHLYCQDLCCFYFDTYFYG